MLVLMQAIEELPGQESPEIFGLHPNADLTFRTLQVQAGVQLIVDTQPKGGGGGGRLSREEVVDRICEDLLSKVRGLGLSCLLAVTHASVEGNQGQPHEHNPTPVGPCQALDILGTQE